MVSYLISRLRSSHSSKFPKHFGVLDLCTGTGCIPLLFCHALPYKELGVQSVGVLGIDVSGKAVTLARNNQRRLLQDLVTTTATKFDSIHDVRLNNIRAMRFMRGDILDDSTAVSNSYISKSLHRAGQPKWDFLISNPPYISPRAFGRTTSRSVRNYEPKLALVPPSNLAGSDEGQGDLFYPQLLKIADNVDANIFLVEVADIEQAQRVVKMAQRHQRWEGVEIWRDQLDIHRSKIEAIENGVPVIGQGNGRAVFCYTRSGGYWIHMIS